MKRQSAEEFLECLYLFQLTAKDSSCSYNSNPEACVLYLLQRQTFFKNSKQCLSLTNNVCHQLFNVVLCPGPGTRPQHVAVRPPEGHSQGQEVQVGTIVSVWQRLGGHHHYILAHLSISSSTQVLAILGCRPSELPTMQMQSCLPSTSDRSATGRTHRKCLFYTLGKTERLHEFSTTQILETH